MAGALGCPAVPEHYLAIDIGASRLAAGVVDAGGAVLVRDRVATPARHVWISLVRLIGRVLAAAPDDAEPTACGVSCSGPIDRETGAFTPAQVSAWAGFPLRAELEATTGLPVAIDQPGRALAAAECWCGVGRRMGNFVTVVVGDTVDAGIVADGRLLDGRTGAVGQIGHLTVEPEGRQCICGALGCLDAYASSSAIETETNRPLARTPEAIIERAGVMLARAIASLAAMTDPEAVLIAGHVPSVYGAPLFAAIDRELEQRIRLTHLAGLRVVPFEGGPGASLVAAAAVARGRSAASPS